mmetsp:Transcript_164426/g.527317  ORF Transcript_164426/g.527317 Transcript_164426/m.527317 type:complete len:91 (+) Transcript_164426:1501-1773(+)
MVTSWMTFVFHWWLFFADEPRASIFSVLERHQATFEGCDAAGVAKRLFVSRVGLLPELERVRAATRQEYMEVVHLASAEVGALRSLPFGL